MSLSLRYALRSDVGKLREENEDSAYAGPRLVAVADGMGGHAAGEVASQTVIAALGPLDVDAPGPDLISILHTAVLDANDQLRLLTEQDRRLTGMGTTVTALLSADTHLGLVHVGDSRAYLLRDGALTQITVDHTLVQSLVESGRITAEQAVDHPQRSVITRALDGRDVELDLSVREAIRGDRYLLCTDGLSGVVPDDLIREALRAQDPHEAADTLIELALRGGGPDNVTVVVADVVDTPGGEHTPVIGGAAANKLVTRRGPSRRPFLIKLFAVFALVAALLGAGAAAGVHYLHSRYYVGIDHDHVAIYRGIHGWSSVYESHPEIPTARLTPADIAVLREGTPETTLDKARLTVDNLATKLSP